MNNMQCIVAVLAAHREARRWDDEAVAIDLVAQLGLDPVGEAKNPRLVHDGITEGEVVAHEAAAHLAVEKAKAAREALNAQKGEVSQGDETWAVSQRRKFDAERLGLPSDATQAQVDAEEARQRAAATAANTEPPAAA